MNSVYDRPLFANRKQKRRDARTKLLNMGGIVASSPELMQAVAGYDAGGHVHPHQVPIRSANPLVAILESLKSSNGLAQMFKNIDISKRAGATDASTVENNDLNDLVDSQMETLGLLGGASDVDVSNPAGTVNLSGQLEEVVDNDAVVKNNTMFGTDDLKVSPESMDVDARAEFERMDDIRKQIIDIQNSDASEEDKADETADAIDDPLTGTDEEKYLQYKKMMETAFGKKANAKTIAGLNKQLVGFSMAAGKDPRAVVNIANALKEGAQIAKADLQLDEARADKITEKAMDRMFKEKDDTASSNAAMERAKFTAGARLKAALIQSGARRGRTTSDFVQNVLTEALKNYNLDSQIIGKDQEGNNINESVSQYLDRIVEDTLQSYKGAMKSSGDETKNDGSSLGADQHKTANDAAKQKGQTRYQINGEFFDVQ